MNAAAEHTAMVDWVRSEDWHPALVLASGDIGSAARTAFAAFYRDHTADTLARRWGKASYLTGRDTIKRLLGLPDDVTGSVASNAFRIITDDDGRSWIAGATPCQPAWGDLARWSHLDIETVVLWDPRTGDCLVDGEPTGAVAPAARDEVTVYADPLAFFRAWAAVRLPIAELFQSWTRGFWAEKPREAADGGLPGAFLLGDARLPWRTFSKVVAGPGMTTTSLHSAMMRGSGLPQIVEA